MTLSFTTSLFPTRLHLSPRPARPLPSPRPSRSLYSNRPLHASPAAAALHSSPSHIDNDNKNDNNDDDDNDNVAGVRVNKCFKSFASRRQSDHFVAAGRVLINGVPARPGARVFPGDRVCLDGTPVHWQRLVLAPSVRNFSYLKHWKQPDVVCTTDPAIPNNIIARVLARRPTPHRVFPVGRLDEASTGLILLTSDGRLPNAILGAGKDCAKEYLVTPDMWVTDDHVRRLRQGVVISTVAQRDRQVRKVRTAPTLPCHVRRAHGVQLVMRLEEGRNRQIRKMLGELGYTTRAIHRVAFMGITLDGLQGEGDVKELDPHEMALIEAKLNE